ncbi:hypothetical protein ACLK2B_13445 [Escherichia coli]
MKASTSWPLRQRLWDGIKDIEAVYINGDLEQRVPGNLNVSFAYVEGESLIMALKDLAVSSGFSCCLGQPGALLCTARAGPERRAGAQLHPFQPGSLYHEEEIDYAIKLIRDSIGRLRRCLPCGRCTKTASI